MYKNTQKNSENYQKDGMDSTAEELKGLRNLMTFIILSTRKIFRNHSTWLEKTT